MSIKVLEWEQEARTEEQSGPREALLQLLLRCNCLKPLLRALASSFPQLHLLDMSGRVLTALSGLHTLLARNDQLAAGPVM